MLEYIGQICSIFVEFRLTVDITPVMGLNEILGNALRSLSDENSLTSWSIYNENSGYTVKIRFKLAAGAENLGAGLQYKRKSIKQANRDHERSKAWRATRQADGSDDHPGEVDKLTVVPKLTPPVDASAPHSTMRTRSMARTSCMDTPEMTRSHEPTLCPDITNITVDSVILDVMTHDLQDVSILSVGRRMSSPITAHTSNIPRHVENPDFELDTSVTPSGECVTPEDDDCRTVTGDRRVTSHEAVVQESSSRGSDASSDDDDGPPECLFCWYYDNDPGKCHKHG